MSPYQQEIRVRELLSQRLKKLGSFKLRDAYELIQKDLKLSYHVIRVHFIVIMEEMVAAGQADRICAGRYFIHKNNLSKPSPQVVATDICLFTLEASKISDRA